MIAASPEQVFAVLADGWAYSNWVTGTSHMRAVDADWPAVGSKIHHAAGVWPAVARDETVVELNIAGQRLELTARGRPFGEARVVIELTAEGTGTRADLGETPIAGPGKWLNNPGTEALLTRRNAESLARLAAIAERRTHPKD
ncbi:MAG: SRPBCC family protein [Acidimicrobiales bacterium]